MRSLLYYSTWKCTHDVISSMLEDLASSWLFPLLQNETFDLKNKANAIYQGPQRPIFRHAPSQKIALAKMISIILKNYFVTQILHDK